jgi:fatty-acyl-CoA synthase
VRETPDASVNMGSFLAERAASSGERTAVVVDATGERISYAELDARADRAAVALRSFGVAPGDRVALALPSTPLYLALYHACARLGAILVPLNTRLAPPELAFQIADCEPTVLVRTDEMAVPDAGARHSLSPDALLEAGDDAAPPSGVPPGGKGGEVAQGGEVPQILMYTSGTTGRPKGALLPHRKTLYNTLNAVRYFRLESHDVVVAPVPLFHSFGLLILAVPTLYCGGSLVLVDKFDPLRLQRSVAENGGTLLAGVPVMFQRMLRSGLDREALASLRRAFSAGAPIDVETIRRFAEAGIPIQQGYGQTETSILCCLDAADALRKAGSVGRPVHWGELRIVDDRGRDVPRAEPGEIVVRGPIVMLGYWRRSEETRESRLDGWHRTGDRAVMDDEGFVTLVGRFKDMYISGGENVYAAEVERVLEAHPDVVEAAVVGVPDAEWGEVGRAYVVPAASPLDSEALVVWAGERLARYKLPRQVVTLDALPRTASGKVQKHLLVERDESES